MTKQEFLTENRDEVISYFNNEITKYWTISLASFMTDLMKSFRKVSIKEDFTRMDLIGNLSEAKSKLGLFDKIKVETTVESPKKYNPFMSDFSKRQLPSSMR